MARFYLRISPVLLLIHLMWKVIDSDQSYWRDLVLYNAIWIIVLATLVGAPIVVNRGALACLSMAILFWGIGSLLSSLTQFGAIQASTAASLSYALFYPPLFIAISRFSGGAAQLKSLEIFDAVIFILGLTSLLTTLVLLTLYPDGTLNTVSDFFLIFYPIADILLLTIVTIQVLTRGLGTQHILLIAASLIFTTADIYFLWANQNGTYRFGAMSDDLWLLAIIFYLFALYKFDGRTPSIRPIPSVLTAIAIFASPILLALSALNPGLIPTPLLLPSLANILLALIRMNIALREARALSDERRLARTDELTGLPNRRRMIYELENIGTIESALMLLDLDGFKPVNDQFGHLVGDQILREVARRFTRSLPDGALLARLGGDEFGVIARGNREETLEVAYALRASLSYPFRIAGRQISVSVSIGHVQNDGAGDLLKRADIAMYSAKNSDEGVVQSLSL